jgi:hypothetical protein
MYKYKDIKRQEKKSGEENKESNKDEISPIPNSYAITKDITVMVKSKDTHITLTAM